MADDSAAAGNIDPESTAAWHRLRDRYAADVPLMDQVGPTVAAVAYAAYQHLVRGGDTPWRRPDVDDLRTALALASRHVRSAERDVGWLIEAALAPGPDGGSQLTLTAIGLLLGYRKSSARQAVTGRVPRIMTRPDIDGEQGGRKAMRRGPARLPSIRGLQSKTLRDLIDLYAQLRRFELAALTSAEHDERDRRRDAVWRAIERRLGDTAPNTAPDTVEGT